MLSQKGIHLKLKLASFLNVFYQMNFYCMKLSDEDISLEL